MPKFLEKKLKARYGNNPHAIYGTLNKIGAMRGNKETAKGKAMAKKHSRKMKAAHRKHNFGNRHATGKPRSYGGRTSRSRNKAMMMEHAGMPMQASAGMRHGHRKMKTAHKKYNFGNLPSGTVRERDGVGYDKRGRVTYMHGAPLSGKRAESKAQRMGGMPMRRGAGMKTKRKGNPY